MKNEIEKTKSDVPALIVRLQPATPVKARMGDLILPPQVALHARKTTAGVDGDR